MRPTRRWVPGPFPGLRPIAADGRYSTVLAIRSRPIHARRLRGALTHVVVRPESPGENQTYQSAATASVRRTIRRWRPCWPGGSWLRVARPREIDEGSDSHSLCRRTYDAAALRSAQRTRDTACD